MGTINHGILGGFSGKVGPVVGTRWNGIDIMRSRSTNRSDTKTAAQLERRARFAAIIDFLKPLKGFLFIGFKSKAVRMSAFNAATSYHMANAISGTYPDYQIDYSKAMVSQGKLPGALNPAASSGQDAEIGFTWANNSSRINAGADDKAILIIYNPVKQMALSFMEGNTRLAGNQSVTLPAGFSGDEVHCYLSFQNASRSVLSDSGYVGSLMVL